MVVFIGTTMMLIDIVEIAVLVSLGGAVAVLAVTMVASLKTARRRPAALPRDAVG